MKWVNENLSLPEENTFSLSWRMSLSYRNQSIDLHSKSMDWFLYDRDHRYERLNNKYKTPAYISVDRLVTDY